jgi:hypothetical protein
MKIDALDLSLSAILMYITVTEKDTDGETL